MATSRYDPCPSEIFRKEEIGGWIAQLVEHRTENPGVGGSIPPPAICEIDQITWSQGGLGHGCFPPLVSDVWIIPAIRNSTDKPPSSLHFVALHNRHLGSDLGLDLLHIELDMFDLWKQNASEKTLVLLTEIF